MPDLSANGLTGVCNEQYNKIKQPTIERSSNYMQNTVMLSSIKQVSVVTGGGGGFTEFTSEKPIYVLAFRETGRHS